MRTTTSREKRELLEQYRIEVEEWVAKNGPIPLIPITERDVKALSIKERDSQTSSSYRSKPVTPSPPPGHE